jgi:transposase
VIQTSPGQPIFVVHEPIRFNGRLKGTLAICRDILRLEPMDGCYILFRNMAGTMLRAVFYDGDGFWLCEKTFSKGRIVHWPSDSSPYSSASARELLVLLWRGNPSGTAFPDLWHKVPA